MFSSSAFGQGFLLQASLIMALGAQNIFVLESGLRKRRPALVAFTCTVCDLILILLGVAGAASVFVAIPSLKIGFGLLGCGFLLFYGLKKILESPPDIYAQSPWQLNPSARSIALQAMTFSLINPHVYLDTIVLIGGFAAKFETLSERLCCGLGAATFSALWFFSLAFSSSALKPLINNQKKLRLLMGAAGVILIFLAVQLGLEVLVWIAEL